MHLSTKRATIWTLALAAIVALTATAAVALASKRAHRAALPSVSNGGARQWIAFDPQGRTIGPVQFLSKIVTIVNTSTASNGFSVYYEPQHVLLCGTTLAAGAMTRCGVQSSQQQELSGGYFQVIAAQPVLMGGYTEVPTLSYAQESPTGPFGAETTKGTIQNIPLIWQQGCPPRKGTGCPVSPTSGVAVKGTKNVKAKH
ncbi:MAG TPA: hypothetical protein VGH21_05785 [Solirubrobacteraceae bacterium]